MLVFSCLESGRLLTKFSKQITAAFAPSDPFQTWFYHLGNSGEKHKTVRPIKCCVHRSDQIIRHSVLFSYLKLPEASALYWSIALHSCCVSPKPECHGAVWRWQVFFTPGSLLKAASIPRIYLEYSSQRFWFTFSLSRLLHTRGLVVTVDSLTSSREGTKQRPNVCWLSNRSWPMKPHYVPVQSSLYYMQHPVDMVVRRIFPGGAKSGKIKFSFSKLRKQPFFAKNVTEKCQILKSIPPAPPFRHPFLVDRYSQMWEDYSETNLGPPTLHHHFADEFSFTWDLCSVLIACMRLGSILVTLLPNLGCLPLACGTTDIST